MAAECAEGLPGTALEHPFGPEWDVHKVRGKVFMLVTDVTGEPMVSVKSAPDEAAALREQHSEITPGYHMNKKHWITLEGGGSLHREARYLQGRREGLPDRHGRPRRADHLGQGRS